MGYYYFCFEHQFYTWNKLYSLFGSSILHTSLILTADWLSRILGPFNVFSLLSRRANRGGVYCGDITVSRL